MVWLSSTEILRVTYVKIPFQHFFVLYAQILIQSNGHKS